MYFNLQKSAILLGVEKKTNKRISSVFALILTLFLTFTAAASAGEADQEILFASQRDGNYEIYSMNADGSDQRRLTNNPRLDWDPSWSPDKTKIVFMSTRDDTELERGDESICDTIRGTSADEWIRHKLIYTDYLIPSFS
jgi:hypothetical protein